MGFSNPPFSRRGALVYRSTDILLPLYLYNIPFNAEIYDPEGLHSTTTDTHKITVPAGVSQVRLIANLDFTIINVVSFSAYIVRNNTQFSGSPSVAAYLDNTTIPYRFNFASFILDATPGDYYGVQINTSVSSTLTLVGGNYSWFAMEIYK